MIKLRNGQIVLVKGKRWKVSTMKNLYGQQVSSLNPIEGENYDIRPLEVQEAEAKRRPWMGP